MQKRGLSPEIKRKIRHITLQTKRVVRGLLIGDSRSAQKGVGFSFDQIRQYSIGDDVRFIDWSATARMGTPLIKQYCQERNRTVLIALDISASTEFGSANGTKRDRASQIASVLSLIACMGNDQVGLLLFTDEIEYFIPPRRGMTHSMLLMEQIFSRIPQKKKTDYTRMFEHLLHIQKTGWITYMISDFIGELPDAGLLKAATKRGDVIAIRCLDQREKEIKGFGFLPIKDLETEEEFMLDVRKSISLLSPDHLENQAKLLKKNGIDCLDIDNQGCFIGTLIAFFRRRMSY